MKVFVDDGSKDDGYKILLNYSSEYNFIKVITRENKGNLVSRLDGANEAEGEDLLFFYQDDFYHRDLIVELDKVPENTPLMSFRLDTIKLMALKSFINLVYDFRINYYLIEKPS